MDCIGSIFKYLLFAGNFLVFVASCACLGIGIFAYVDGDTLNDLFALIDGDATIGVYTTAAVIIMIASSIMLVVSFFGCCGAMKESKWMLGTYCILLLAMLGAMIAGAVIGYDQILDEFKEPLFKTMEDYDETSSSDDAVAAVKAWDQAQIDYECCGMDTWEDWKTHGKFPMNVPDVGRVIVPASCCDRVPDEDICRRNPAPEKLIGCWTKFEQDIEEHEDLLHAVGISAIVLMVVNLLLTVVTICNA